MWTVAKIVTANDSNSESVNAEDACTTFIHHEESWLYCRQNQQMIFFATSGPASGPIRPHVQYVQGALISRVQQAGRVKLTLSPPPNSKVKNKKSRISTPNRISRHAQRQVYLYLYPEAPTTVHSWHIKQHAALHVHRNEKTWKTHLLAMVSVGKTFPRTARDFYTAAEATQSAKKALKFYLVVWWNKVGI